MNEKSMKSISKTNWEKVDSLSEERIIKLEEQRVESDQRFNITLQEIRHISQRVDQVEESP